MAYELSNKNISPMDEYAYIKDLGKGTFGHVCLMQNLITTKFEAIKFIKNKQITYNIQDEITNHAILGDHPNIIKFNNVFVLDEHICISLEYAYSGDMFHYIHSKNWIKSEIIIRSYFMQMISAVYHCHTMGICHRDIKLENLLINNETIKLCDFGYSCRLDNLDKKVVGTIAYIAPEILSKTQKDGTKLDIWSCGVVLYCMLFGHYPFQNMDNPKDLSLYLKNVLNNNYIMYNTISLECQDFIGRIFVLNPDDRISIIEMFSHPWFKAIELKSASGELLLSANSVNSSLYVNTTAESAV